MARPRKILGTSYPAPVPATAVVGQDHTVTVSWHEMLRESDVEIADCDAEIVSGNATLGDTVYADGSSMTSLIPTAPGQIWLRISCDCSDRQPRTRKVSVTAVAAAKAEESDLVGRLDATYQVRNGVSR